MATSTKTNNDENKGELLRLKDAKKKSAISDKGENPIKDGPNKVLDAKGLELAKELLEKYGMEKLEKLFPDMAKILSEGSE